MRLVVLAKPGGAHLSVLERLPADVKATIGPDVKSLSGVIEEAEVIVNGGHDGEVLQALWPKAKSLKWIHSLSAGVENLVFPELRKSLIPLTNARGVYKKSLAEFAILGMLYFAKDVRRLMRQHQAGQWEQFDVEEIRLQVCGVVGYGEIGREVAKLAKTMGMTVLATRRRVVESSDEFADEILPANRMADVLSRSDYVIACSPLTPETRHMIGAQEFAAMKPSGVFMNIGRGAVVDEPAMIAALSEGKIRGAALDVFETEPLPKDSPLWRLENVLLSPHSADHTATWQQDSVEFFLENFARYRKGEPLLNVVDKQAGY